MELRLGLEMEKIYVISWFLLLKDQFNSADPAKLSVEWVYSPLSPVIFCALATFRSSYILLSISQKNRPDRLSPDHLGFPNKFHVPFANQFSVKKWALFTKKELGSSSTIWHFSKKAKKILTAAGVEPARRISPSWLQFFDLERIQKS